MFRAPLQGDPPNGDRSVLYLLRRDLVDLTTVESRHYRRKIRPPMASALAIMSGVDFIAKLDTGKLEGSYQEDFKGVLTKYGEVSPWDAAALYQFRCALAHNYGYFTIRRSRHLKTKPRYSFALDTRKNPKKLIEKIGRSYYRVNFWPLRAAFFQSITGFEKKLRTWGTSDHKEARTNFWRVAKYMGFMCVTADAPNYCLQPTRAGEETDGARG